VRKVDDTYFPMPRRSGLVREQALATILRSPVGSVFELTQGEDFDGEPSVARAALQTSLRSRGMRIATRTREGHLYVRVQEIQDRLAPDGTLA